jgi:hypothetical protein
VHGAAVRYDDVWSLPRIEQPVYCVLRGQDGRKCVLLPSRSLLPSYFLERIILAARNGGIDGLNDDVLGPMVG